MKHSETGEQDEAGGKSWRINALRISILPALAAMKIAPTAHLPAHELVIRPLLDQAYECRVYKASADAKIHTIVQSCSASIARSYAKLDLTRELIQGYEELWNANGGRRGTIVMLFEDVPELEEILPHCSKPLIYSWRQLLKGHTGSAIKHARELTAIGGTAICLSRNNGLEWIDIIAPESVLDLIYDMAHYLARPLEDFDLIGFD